MTVLRLALLFWRRGGVRQRASLGLTAVGVFASTGLALLAMSAAPAVTAGAVGIAWREPQVAPEGSATALQHRINDGFEQRVIQRVDLAATGRGTPPVPPGLDRFPAPGEVFLSPALAAEVASNPSHALGDRFPGEVAGTIGREALAHGGEYAAVVGISHDEMVARDVHHTFPDYLGVSDVVGIDGFGTEGNDRDLGLYRVLAQTAAVLLVVPTFILVGASARLTAAAREQRLAALRLAGATPATVVGLTALETVMAAAIGVVAGIAGYLAVLPLVARIPLAGARFSVTDLRLPLPVLAGALVVVPIAAAAVAVAALRRVAIGPLGVAAHAGSSRPRAARLLVVPVAWVGFVAAALSMRRGGSTTVALVGLAAVIATLAVTGPWITWMLGGALRRLARRPAPLIAGRRIAADPAGAYRTVSGMALAGLIAGFLFGVIPTVDQTTLTSHDGRSMWVDLDEDELRATEPAIRAVDPGAFVVWFPTAMDRDWANALVVPSTPAAHEAVRTAFIEARPGVAVVGPEAVGTAQLVLADLGRASTIMSIAALAMALVAIAISGSSSILDQRTTLARLRLVGTPVAVLQQARRWQVLVPLGVASSGAMVFGAVAGIVMLNAYDLEQTSIERPAVLPMVVLGVAALVTGAAVVAVTRPLLVAVCRATPRDE